MIVRFYAMTVLFIGMFSTQVIATIHVYRSNLALLHTTIAVGDAGYLNVPNAQVMSHLDKLATAAAGGLFFTLSIGAGLSLLTLIAAWLWERVFRRRRLVSGVYLIVLSTGIASVNLNGWNPMASAYLVVVPSVTWLAAICLLPDKTVMRSRASVLWPVAAALILTLLWGLVLDRSLFINIRDYLLLGTRFGQAVTDAYYTYTLYPAEAFKSLAQKQIRTCVLERDMAPSVKERLDRTMRSHNYLPVPVGDPAHVDISYDAEEKLFSMKHHHVTVMQVPADRFFAETGKTLSAYSDNLDKNRIFRMLTLACLLIGYPLTLYILVYSILAILPGLFFSYAVTDAVTAGLCLAIGTLLLVPVYQGSKASVDIGDMPEALSKPSEITRIAALRQAYAAQRDITRDILKHNLIHSDHVAERYWLARNLAHANAPESRGMLLSLADDPSPIVACQALRAMGVRNDRAVIPEIINRINSSAQWYVQMYAYRALRKLGWNQPRSPHVIY
jgi:low affinity Fe/Cu permease